MVSASAGDARTIDCAMTFHPGGLEGELVSTALLPWE